MLDANQREWARWRNWFDRQSDDVLEIPLSIAQAKNVREVLLHIFAVELRYAERLSGVEVTPYEALPIASVEDLFGIGERAGGMYRDYLSQASDSDLSIVLEFPTRSAGMLRASKRKIFAHAMLHSVRHQAQLATALREQGHPTDWAHDFLFNEAIE
jgi:uncharacterized damage-inducible protein DinB